MKKFGLALMLSLCFYVSYSQNNLPTHLPTIKSINQREQQLSFILYEQWNGQNWNNNLKINYEYNAVGLVEEFTIYYYENFQWKKTQRQLLSYDEFINISQIIIQTWDSGAWHNQNEITYEYTEDYLLHSTLIKTWESTQNQWVNQSLEICYYNLDLLDYKLRDFWGSSSWHPQNREEYYYDIDENLLEVLQLAWVVNQWQDETRISYQYAAGSSEPSQMFTQYFYLDEWENSTLEEYLYNPQEQLSVSDNYIWSNGWTENLRREYSYNEYFETEQIWQYIWQDGWTNDLKISYNYQEVTAQEHYISATNLIYPNHFINPTNLKFSLHSPAYGWAEIYNLRGQIVKISPIKNYQVNWNLSNGNSNPIGSGIYFVVIKEQKQIKKIEKISIIK